MTFNTTCFDLHVSSSGLFYNPTILHNKPEAGLYRAKHVVLKLIQFQLLYVHVKIMIKFYAQKEFYISI